MISYNVMQTRSYLPKSLRHKLLLNNNSKLIEAWLWVYPQSSQSWEIITQSFDYS